MKRYEFIEDFANPHADPLAEACYEFPYDEVFAHLDGPGQEAEVRREAREQAAAALRGVLAWIVSGTPTARFNEKLVARRAIVVAWCLSPTLLGGQSLASIARGLNFSPPRLHSLTAEVAQKFSLRNRAQKQGWNRGKRKGNPLLSGFKRGIAGEFAEPTAARGTAPPEAEGTAAESTPSPGAPNRQQ